MFRFLRLLLVLLALASPNSAIGASCEPGDPPAPGLNLVREAFELLSAVFVDPLEPTTLLGPATAALEGEALQSQLEPSEADQPATWDTFADQYCLLWQTESEGSSPERAAHAAIVAMVAAINEGHTQFLPPEAYREYLALLRGRLRYGGIGVRIARNPLRIEAVFPGSPAEAAGLRRGDQILAVDGRDVAAMAPGEIPAAVRGEAGTPVRLTVARGAAVWDVDIVRADLRPPSFDSRPIEEFGYLRIYAFAGSALDEEVAGELRSFRARDLKGLVLDLRGNSGGRLDVGTRVAGLLLPTGTPLYRETTRNGEPRVNEAVGERIWTAPVVVLVDGGTASMAEILAAALQEQGAVVIGSRTAGVVAAAIVVPLSDGSAVQVTVSRIASGRGRVLNGSGLEPDLLVGSGDGAASEDEALAAAVAHLRSQTAAPTPTPAPTPRTTPTPRAAGAEIPRSLSPVHGGLHPV